MPRPKKPRFVSSYPTIAAFVPQGMPISGELMLSVEELEAIRLSDFECLDQESAANLMQVSRQTYGRILATARHIVGEALVTGKASGSAVEIMPCGAAADATADGGAGWMSNHPWEMTQKGGEKHASKRWNRPGRKGPASRTWTRAVRAKSSDARTRWKT
ncbi:DUF134 domain-containing protein [Desulfosarcina cetonica]|uniref:DUF134 domain-containing protein n=1 Tax=Desulfosarcina cetonica TaxID=90730 RepID=UPI001FEDCD26|nr:DUF134 domain-containing protein [Desulfosarcina cetonica]